VEGIFLAQPYSTKRGCEKNTKKIKKRMGIKKMFFSKLLTQLKFFLKNFQEGCKKDSTSKGEKQGMQHPPFLQVGWF